MRWSFLFLLWQSGSGSEVYGGKGYWSNQALEEEKFQNTNLKYQTNHNDQSASGGPNLFWSLNIGIWDFIVIWCLEFDILQCSTTRLRL
jgi:hypothetical protein